MRSSISFLSSSLSPYIQICTFHICMYKKITNLVLACLLSPLPFWNSPPSLVPSFFMRNGKKCLSICLPCVTHGIIDFPPSFSILSFLFQTAKSGFKQFLIQQLFLNFLQGHPVAFFCVSLLLLHHLKQNTGLRVAHCSF